MKLSDALDKHFRLKEGQKKGLKKRGLQTIEDLLFHFPSRYGDVFEVKEISDLKDGEEATVYGRVKSAKTGKTFRGNIPQAEAVIEGVGGSVYATWLHQPYIAKKLEQDSSVKISGRAKRRSGKLSFTNPEIEIVSKIPIGVGNSLFGDDSTQYLRPVYPESKGVSSQWIQHKIKTILSNGLLDELKDPIPNEILSKYKLPKIETALIWIHSPKRKSDAEIAMKRFAFQEIFFIQLARQKERREREKKGAFVIKKSEENKKKFLKNIPFSLTGAQERAIDAILKDISTPKAMSRLLEGDVGSGKTMVAAASAYAVVNTPPPNQDFGALQVAYMVPTEILAKQQFESFIQNFKHLPIKIALITSSGCRKFPSKVNTEKSTPVSRTQLLKWIKNGEIAVTIGTHSLIQEKVQFQNLAYVIIDEQHRFGTIQRKNLLRKDKITPHLLSMTATPIPRTLALTIYGDLDLTLLDEMPPGRKEVITEIVSPKDRDRMFEKIRRELKKGRQAYVICPRIEEPDPAKEAALLAASVKEEKKYLEKEIFPEFKIKMLYGKMKPKEKDEVMKEFEKKKIDILVSTSVIEVGVNVPNATVILIEGAGRFGLAQLHQLRGRVLRSNHQAYCFIANDSDNKKTLERLSAIKKARNGFELAEYDLAQRGSGELSGARQWGVSDLGMVALRNIKMVEAAREEAKKIIGSDPEFKKKEYVELKNRLMNKKGDIHFE